MIRRECKNALQMLKKSMILRLVVKISLLQESKSSIGDALPLSSYCMAKKRLPFDLDDIHYGIHSHPNEFYKIFRQYQLINIDYKCLASIV